MGGNIELVLDDRSSWSMPRSSLRIESLLADLRCSVISLERITQDNKIVVCDIYIYIYIYIHTYIEREREIHMYIYIYIYV